MDSRDRIDTLCEKLEAGDRGGSDADRDALMALSDRLFLLAQDYTDYRHEKLLRHCVRMSELAVDGADGFVDAVGDQDVAETVGSWINPTYDNEESNRDYRAAVSGHSFRHPQVIEIERNCPNYQLNIQNIFEIRLPNGIDQRVGWFRW